MSDAAKITMKMKQEQLWQRGILAPWKLHRVQKEIYDAFWKCRAKKFVINAGRRSGKSWLLCVIAIEFAIQHPNSDIKFATPTQRQSRKIIHPLFRQILANCPKPLKPRYRTFDSVWEFPNGSTITVAGCDGSNADSLRGTQSHLAIVDEAGFVDADKLHYVVQDILLPQSLLTGGRIILSSTPPVSGSHPFMQFVAQALESDAYIKRTIHDNPMVSAEEIEEVKREAGGENSVTWRREYLCDFITDSNYSVIPEATDAVLEQIVYEMPRPPFFHPHTAVDLGYTDGTGAVLGYYNFPHAKIVIEDELFLARSTSDVITAAVRDIERSLWTNARPPLRVVDGPALAIADLNAVHKFACRAPDKSDLTANINRLRMLIADRKIAIHPKCRNLISQIKFATWADDARKKFSRDSGGYHFDLLAALIYFVKHVDMTTNPFPPGYGYDPYNDFGYATEHNTSTVSVIKRMFPMLRR